MLLPAVKMFPTLQTLGKHQRTFYRTRAPLSPIYFVDMLLRYNCPWASVHIEKTPSDRVHHFPSCVLSQNLCSPAVPQDREFRGFFSVQEAAKKIAVRFCKGFLSAHYQYYDFLQQQNPHLYMPYLIAQRISFSS